MLFETVSLRRRIFIYCAYLIQKYFSLGKIFSTFNARLSFMVTCSFQLLMMVLCEATISYYLKNQIIQATGGNTTTIIWLSNKASSQVLTWPVLLPPKLFFK